jgi:hypothetical protein
MTTRTPPPFDRVVPVSALREGETLSSGTGQSRKVCTLANHPGWLIKEYWSEMPASEVERLDRLIGLPASMGPPERALVETSTSWPVARVVDGPRTVGVCLPTAPASFFAPLRSVNGNKRRKEVRIDLLALSDDRIGRLGLAAPTLPDRIAVCATLGAVGALLERHGLVYLDWSYGNAFWGCTTRGAYVIDVDGCSFGPRLQIETPGWMDPLVPRQTMAGNGVDRYRLALLVARCLTAERDLPAVCDAVDRLAAAPSTADVGRHLIGALTAGHMTDRPSLRALAEVLAAAASPVPRQRYGSPDRELTASGVIGWRPVGPRPGRTPRAVGPGAVGPPAVGPAAASGPPGQLGPVRWVTVGDRSVGSADPSPPTVPTPSTAHHTTSPPEPARSGSGARLVATVIALVLLGMLLAVIFG